MRTRVSSLVAPAGLLAGLLVAAMLGWLAPQQPVVAVTVAALVLLLGITALHPVAVPLMALPLLYGAARISVGATDLSVSDAALGVATLTVLVFSRHPPSPPLRRLLWLTAVYQTATLFTVIANPYPANAIEWVHAGVLVAGALLLGWTIGREGYAGLGLKLMLAAAAALAGWVIVVGVLQYAAGDLRPVYLPLSMHKNFLGTVLGTTALVAYVRPAWLGLGVRSGMVIFTWLVVAVGFTQSRQAIVGVGVALVVLVLRTRTDRRRSKAVLLAVIPAMLVVLTLVRDQLASDNIHNSAFSRLKWFEDSIAIWQTQPITGVGLRWWYTDRFPGGFQPPNAELEVLTASGILGLLAFVVLMIGTLLTLWRLPPAYGTLASLVVLSRLTQGQLDIFWVAAQTSIPFVIAGICLGAHALDESDHRSVDALDDVLAGGRPVPALEGRGP